MASLSATSLVSSSAPAAMNMASSQAGLSKISKAAQNMHSALSEKDMKKIDATAQDFEAVFITEMLKPVFNTVDVDSQFGGGKGEEVFRDFMTNEYGKMLSHKGGFGIASAVKDQLIRLQEHSKNPAENTEVTAMDAPQKAAAAVL